MPIEIESKEWEEADYIDWLRIQIADFLRRNDDYAYSTEEITEHIEENDLEVFPEDLRNGSEIEEQLRKNLVFSRLQSLLFEDWVDVKVTDGTHYFVYKSGAPHIVAKVRHDIPEQLDSLEEKIDQRPDRLKERLEWLEHRVGEEIRY